MSPYRSLKYACLKLLTDAFLPNKLLKRLVIRLDVNLSNLEFLLSWNNKMFYNIDNCSKILVVLSLAESRRGTQQ